MTSIDGPQTRILLLVRSAGAAAVVVIFAVTALVAALFLDPAAAVGLAAAVAALAGWRIRHRFQRSQGLPRYRYLLALAVRRHPGPQRRSMSQWPVESPAWPIVVRLLDPEQGLTTEPRLRRHVPLREFRLAVMRQVTKLFAAGPEDPRWRRSTLEVVAGRLAGEHGDTRARETRARALALLIGPGRISTSGSRTISTSSVRR